MHKSSWISAVIILGVSFSTAGSLRAEEEVKGQTAPPSNQDAAPAKDKKAVLVDASRVSTDNVAKSASKQKPKEESPQDTSKQSEDSAVTELRPAPPNQESAGAKPESPEAKKKSKGGPLKDIHGTVYGGAGPGGQTTGAAAGAKTKSGKASIYVEAQRENAKDPRR
jgi:hypothetical protein